MFTSIIFVLLMFLLPASKVDSAVEKPYVLKVAMTAPLGGTVNPMGPVCSESVNFVLNAINSSPNILPNYKLTIDIADDACADVPGLRRSLSFFEQMKPSVPADKVYGDMTLPSSNNKNFSGTAYVPPIFLGGICSAVCKVTARLAPHFNYIDVVAGCSDPAMTDPKRYPNFYRFSPSNVEIGVARVKLMDLMSWNKIAILSDASPSSYTDTLYFMKTIQQFPTFSVSMEEFFMSDPGESIARMKAADVRLIFASCFLNICPAIACSAYEQGLYGDKIVWIFNANVDLLSANLARPKGCSKQMTDAFAEHSLYVGSDSAGNFLNADTKTDIGTTVGEYNRYMSEKVPNWEKTPAYGWRMSCADLPLIAGHILDNVERNLQAENETLKDVIANENRKPELRELIRRSTLSINSTTFRGLAAFQPGTTEAYTPVMLVEQVQSGVRKPVFFLPDRTVMDGKKAFQLIRKPIWGSSDGRPPRNEPVTMSRFRIVPSHAVYAVFSVHAFLILSMWALVLTSHFYRSEIGLGNYDWKILLTVIGTTIILATVFAFPASSTTHTSDSFCGIAPPMLIIGFTLLSIGFMGKLWCIRLSLVVSTSSRRHGILLPLTIWLLMNSVLIIVWYCGSQRPFAVVLTSSNYDNVKDTIWSETSYTCSLSNGSEFLIAILALQAVVLVLAIFFAAATTYSSKRLQTFSNNNNSNTIRELNETAIGLYTMFSIAVVSTFALFVFHQSEITFFGILVAFAIGNSLSTMLILHRSAVAFILAKVGVSAFKNRPTALELTGGKVTNSRMPTPGVTVGTRKSARNSGLPY